MTSHELPGDHEQLERAIASLEAQRATLGDVVVDTTISALHQRLAEAIFADIGAMGDPAAVREALRIQI